MSDASHARLPSSTGLPPTPRASGSLLRAIADAIPASIAYFEAKTLRCRFANERYARWAAHTCTSILGLHARDVVGAQVWADIAPQVQQCLAGQAVRYSRLYSGRKGGERMLEVNLVPHLHGSTILGAFVLIHDITPHWQAQRAVHDSHERMRKFSAATDEVIIFHREGRITDSNEALERLTGYTLAQVIGTQVFDYIAPEYRQTALDYTRSESEDLYEAALIHRDGYSIPVEVVGKTMPIDGQSYRIVVLRDISARKQAQEHAAFMAQHDHLTHLPNRHSLMAQLSHTLQRLQHTERGESAGHSHSHNHNHNHSPGRAALLSIDLDHFKTVNDSLGHQAGDALLCAMAQRLKSCVAPTDVVARLGGDEFAVFLPHITHAQEAAAVADKLLSSMAAPYTLGEMQVALSPSIGISLYPEDGSAAEELLRHADLAMYQAKDSGRANRQFYQRDLDARTPLEELRLERQLREAIQQEAFVLHYQPQIRLSDAALVGFEALVRWQHPERGIVGPDEFIAFAEGRGLIAHIDRWVLNEACCQLKAWHDAGLPRVCVAVNLSALELRQRDVVADVRSVLQATGLQAQYLEVEITESVLMQQAAQAHNALTALQALGVRISIDDFGTGYSSLAYLKRYPIDKLKIDRSFVMDTPANGDDVAIVTAIIQMGHSLQLQVVAEGMETSGQQVLLQRLGCDLAQGWGVSRPMGAKQAVTWMQSYQSVTHQAFSPTL